MAEPDNVYVKQMQMHAAKIESGGCDSVVIDGEIFKIPGLRTPTSSPQPQARDLHKEESQEKDVFDIE